MSKNKDLLARLVATLLPQSGLAGLLTMSSSPDGFKRENAVRRLGMLGNPLAIPHLIERANDWVPQVRAAAYDALIRLLEAGNGAAFVASLPALLHLQSCRRGDHSGLLAAIHGFLLREDNREALMVGMQNPDPRVARVVTHLLVSRQLSAPVDLLWRGLSHADVVVRATVIDLLRDLGSGEFDAAVAEALADNYMPVRREAFQQLLRRDPVKGMNAARQFLFDSSASIREIAVKHLRSVGEPVEDVYARALAGSRDRVAVVKCVLWGWGLLNSQHRVQHVTELLESRYAGVRRAALQAITKLLRADACPHLQAALSDVSPAVCNEAVRLIRKIGVIPDTNALIRIASANAASHVAHACCRVIRDGNKWEWLRFILSVYGLAAATVAADILSREINAWDQQFNRSSAQPDRDQIADVARLMRASEANLSAYHAELLKFTLRSYGLRLN